MIAMVVSLCCSYALCEDGATTVARVRAESNELQLVDGVYPVVSSGEAEEKGDSESIVLELTNVPVKGQEEASTVRIIDRPLLQFRDVPHFDFKFENGECTEIGFQNTDDLMAYTREHVGSRLAVVINNTVISSHKVREPIKTKRVRITCCTVGGGDHLHEHLKTLTSASDAPAGAPSSSPKLND